MLATPLVAVLAVAGALALEGSAIVALLVVTAAVGGAAAGAAWAESQVTTSARVAGARAAAWTAGGLLVVCGAALLVGMTVTVLAGALLVLALVLVRRPAPGGVTHTAPPPAEPEGPVVLSPLHPAAPVFRPFFTDDGARAVLLQVRASSSQALGEEWLDLSAQLDSSPEPATRQALAARRTLVLDELERRDPDGLARWLAAGAPRGVDPADYVRDEPPAGSGTS
ncbi:hypothetical protein [Blastococcus sp. CCUG 61487]|uniref:hypothetical protein n=1 Tax=Blastococcus sp. CCUG 61487 TaxID=1840703 RepID=UPI0010C14805|nr:hypothetical protein [Blastococcus sp. CCUG 61487]